MAELGRCPANIKQQLDELLSSDCQVIKLDPVRARRSYICLERCLVLSGLMCVIRLETGSDEIGISGLQQLHVFQKGFPQCISHLLAAILSCQTQTQSRSYLPWHLFLIYTLFAAISAPRSSFKPAYCLFEKKKSFQRSPPSLITSFMKTLFNVPCRILFGPQVRSFLFKKEMGSRVWIAIRCSIISGMASWEVWACLGFCRTVGKSLDRPCVWSARVNLWAPASYFCSYRRCFHCMIPPFFPIFSLSSIPLCISCFLSCPSFFFISMAFKVQWGVWGIFVEGIRQHAGRSLR